MRTQVVGVQIAGGSNRFDLVQPFEIVHRFTVKGERGGVEQIADMLTWVDRSGAGQAESGFQAASAANEFGQLLGNV